MTYVLLLDCPNCRRTALRYRHATNDDGVTFACDGCLDCGYTTNHHQLSRNDLGDDPASKAFARIAANRLEASSC